MNYDAFEREILGYGERISSRAERRRVFNPPVAGPSSRAARPVRFQLAVALRSLADHLETGAAHLA